MQSPTLSLKSTKSPTCSHIHILCPGGSHKSYGKAPPNRDIFLQMRGITNCTRFKTLRQFQGHNISISTSKRLIWLLPDSLEILSLVYISHKVLCIIKGLNGYSIP